MLKTKKNFYNEVEKIREFYKFEILEINTIDEIKNEIVNLLKDFTDISHYIIEEGVGIYTI